MQFPSPPSVKVYHLEIVVQCGTCNFELPCLHGVVGNQTLEPKSVRTRVQLLVEGFDQEVDVGRSSALDIDIQMLAVIRTAKNWEIRTSDDKHLVRFAIAQDWGLDLELLEFNPYLHKNSMV